MVTKPIKNQHTVHIQIGSGSAVSSPLHFSVVSHCISKHTEVLSAFPVHESTQVLFAQFNDTFETVLLYIYD